MCNEYDRRIPFIFEVKTTECDNSHFDSKCMQVMNDNATAYSLNILADGPIVTRLFSSNECLDDVVMLHFHTEKHLK